MFGFTVVGLETGLRIETLVWFLRTILSHNLTECEK